MLKASISSLLLLPSLIYGSGEPPLPPIENTTPCIGTEECANSTQTIESGHGLLCEGFGSCGINSIHVEDGFVDCSGQIGCVGSRLLGHGHVEINCGGNAGCFGAAIDIEDGFVRCCGNLGCNNGMIVSGGDVACDGSKGCSEAFLLVKKELRCDGYFGCELARILIETQVLCGGVFSCSMTSIGIKPGNTPAQLVSCDGLGSCAYSLISGVLNVDAPGEGSLVSASIESVVGEVLTVTIGGDYASHDATIYCVPGSHCVVYCETDTACAGLTIFSFEGLLPDGTNYYGTVEIICETQDYAGYHCPIIEYVPVDISKLSATTTTTQTPNDGSDNGVTKKIKLSQENVMEAISGHIEKNEKLKYKFSKTVEKKKSQLKPLDYRIWLNKEMSSMQLSIKQNIEKSKEENKILKAQLNSYKKLHKNGNHNYDTNKYKYGHTNPNNNNKRLSSDASSIKSVNVVPSSSSSSPSSNHILGFSLLWNIIMITIGIFIGLGIYYFKNNMKNTYHKISNQPMYQSI